MKHTIKKGRSGFLPRIGAWPFHGGITWAEWRGHFDDTTWYEPENAPGEFNLGSGWTYGRHRKNVIRWGWRPVKHQNQKMQELCLMTIADGLRTISKDTILIPLEEDFFVQLKTNGTFASLGARPFTGDWQVITVRWPALARKGFWLGVDLGGEHPLARDRAPELKRLVPA